jgi:DNA-3-methyladenine glycosylase II
MNLQEAVAHLSQDANFKPIIEQVPMPVFAPSGRIYYDLLESVVSQQLSVKVADVIFKRFLQLFPDNYPHPHSVIKHDIQILRSVGLSNQKASYLQNIAQFSLENNLDALHWDNMSDEEILALLTQIKGVGKWTVQMLLMFSLGRPDVFPVDDLGIQQAMSRLFKLEENNARLLKLKMTELAEPWRPYRTVACRYLWRWKDNTKLQA